MIHRLDDDVVDVRIGRCERVEVIAQMAAVSRLDHLADRGVTPLGATGSSTTIGHEDLRLSLVCESQGNSVPALLLFAPIPPSDPSVGRTPIHPDSCGQWPTLRGVDRSSLSSHSTYWPSDKEHSTRRDAVDVSVATHR